MDDDVLSLDLFSEPRPGPPADLEASAPEPPPAAGFEGSASEQPNELQEAASEPSPASAPTPATDGRVDDTVWTVSQINRAVRNLLEGTLPPVWVSGEVGGWTRARSGHCYFTLKDGRAQLRGVLFRSDAERLPTDPEEGMKVRALGTVTLYEARGEYQLVTRRLEGLGEEGLWRLAFERLRTKLDGEGLLAPERKRPLPKYPSRVGVVTSTTGAALEDILTVIRRRAPWTEVVVRNARVQGEGASAEIAAALGAMAAHGRVEVVIVGRGGGSIEDLWAFNEEAVARAIAACPVPIVSAVGHEVDVTIADLVADGRAATPSAAAELVVPDGEAIRRSLSAFPGRLARGLRGTVSTRRAAFTDRRQRLHHGLLRLVQPRRVGVDVLRTRMDRAMGGLLERKRSGLHAVAGRLHALSPLSTLERGYAVPLSVDGTLLRGVSGFEVGGPFTLRLVDGRIEGRTTSIQPEERDESDDG